ncbi:hypothetical protein ACPUEK_15365 [Marinomonas gallaica]|uniref:hypothetical protein n=1 Tax=Marinomonas gallaica TaxID=1806667 RepID=UPI003CE462DD
MSAETQLAQYNISVEEARQFLINNISDPAGIVQVADTYKITNEMLAEIYGGVTANQVVEFFNSNGINSTSLDSFQQQSLPTNNVLPLTEFGNVSGNLDTAASEGWYNVYLNANQTYKFTMESNSDMNSSYLKLLNSEGFLEASAIQDSGSNDVEISIIPTESGEYFLSADLFGGDSMGEYSVMLRNTTVNDDYPDNEAPAAIQLDTPVFGEFEVQDDEDKFMIELEADQSYTFSIVSNTLNTTLLTISDADGVMLEDSVEETNVDANESFMYTPSVSGTYYLTATQFSDKTVGNYSINVVANEMPEDDSETDVIGVQEPTTEQDMMA